MSKLTLIVAVVALGLGAFTAYESCTREQRMTELEDGVRGVQDAMTDLDAKLDRVLASGGGADFELLSAADDAPAGPAGSESEAGLATRRVATPGERLAALEKTVAAQRDTIAALEEKADRAAEAPMAPRFMRPSRFLPNVDAAAKALDLNERQKADMQDTIDVAKRELADLYATENDDGQTWKELRTGKMTKVGGGDTPFSISMPDFNKINKFKKSRVPGTAETFGEAEKRIKDRAFADMRRGMTADQGKKWDDAHKDALLGADGSSGGMVISTFTTDLSGNDK